MLQNGLGLLTGDAGEPFEKIVEPGTILEICEERLNRDSRTSKDPRSADPLRISFDGQALAPVKHNERLSDPMNRRQADRQLHFG
jgi:hypothetical protein